MRPVKLVRLLVPMLLVALLGACGVSIPSDPDGTYDRVSGDVLRAGASPYGDLVVNDGGQVSGPQVDLVEQFAERLDAEVEWTVSSEEDLVEQLTKGDLDLVVGGFSQTTPWSADVGVTRGYASVEAAGGRPLVMLVPPGENRFLTELETFLDEEIG